MARSQHEEDMPVPDAFLSDGSTPVDAQGIAAIVETL
jgi:hypothetical protein